MGLPPIGQHWDRIYTSRLEPERSWTQARPSTSLSEIARLDVVPAAPIIDIGGGASRLVDHLVAAGHLDLTVLDVSPSALFQARARLGHDSPVEWVQADITTWVPARRYSVWHDRAVFHFLHDPAEIEHYRRIATDGVAPGGHLVMGTFAPEGPDSCSGLPVRRWSAPELNAMFDEWFEPLTSRTVEHLAPSGAAQPFTWVTLRRSA